MCVRALLCYVLLVHQTFQSIHVQGMERRHQKNVIHGNLESLKRDILFMTALINSRRIAATEAHQGTIILPLFRQGTLFPDGGELPTL